MAEEYSWATVAAADATRTATCAAAVARGGLGRVRPARTALPLVRVDGSAALGGADRGAARAAVARGAVIFLSLDVGRVAAGAARGVARVAGTILALAHPRASLDVAADLPRPSN